MYIYYSILSLSRVLLVFREAFQVLGEDGDVQDSYANDFVSSSSPSCLSLSLANDM